MTKDTRGWWPGLTLQGRARLCGGICGDFRRNWKSRFLSEISQALKHWLNFEILAVCNRPRAKRPATYPRHDTLKALKRCPVWMSPQGVTRRGHRSGGRGVASSVLTSSSGESSLL